MLLNQEAARFRVTSSSKLIGWRMSDWTEPGFSVVLKRQGEDVKSEGETVPVLKMFHGDTAV